MCEIHDKMQVVYKELRRDLIKFKVAKSEFYLWKKVKTRENCVENLLSEAFSSE